MDSFPKDCLKLSGNFIKNKPISLSKINKTCLNPADKSLLSKLDYKLEILNGHVNTIVHIVNCFN